MSVSKLSAGTGYRYLLKHIARGDADQTVDRAGALTDYYTLSGYPPGVWLGRGLAGLGDGAGLAAGSVVGEEQMARLFGAGLDPVTGSRWAGPTARRTGRRVGGRVRPDLLPRQVGVGVVGTGRRTHPAR